MLKEAADLQTLAYMLAASALLALQWQGDGVVWWLYLPTPWLPSLYDLLPLLGLMTHDGRSKWMFSPRAIGHMLPVRERLFREVLFVPSPINCGSTIATCDK